MKFSIIVPVYNVEDYLSSCLDSILKQTYDNFEVIVVNDGTLDNSQEIIDKYKNKDKRIKAYIKKNGGLSDARNYGINRATGDYIVFVDSDDTINEDLLKHLNEVAVDDVDIIRFQVNKVDHDGEFVYKTDVFNSLSGEEAFVNLIKDPWFVTACASAYRRKYWNLNKYMFAFGKLHEDFGLIPFVYVNASKVTAIDYVGYNYYFRELSIMNDNNDKKIVQKNVDCLYHFDKLLEMINESKVSIDGQKYFKSFISYTLINRCNIIIDKKMLNDYIKELKQRKIGNYLINDSIPRKFKKMIFKISPSIFIKMFVK